MRLILDTNVLVSANIQRSYPYLIVDRILADPELQLCISNPLLAEYIEVLSRDKFSKFPDFEARAQAMITDIQRYAIRFNPTETVSIIADEPDNRLLELAAACRASYLVTGNTADFTVAEYNGTKIVSPREMFELLDS